MVPQLTYTIFCTMQIGMSTDLVLFRIYYGNGEIRYGDNEVDLSEFQLFNTELNSPLDYSRKQVLAWLYLCRLRRVLSLQSRPRWHASAVLQTSSLTLRR
jgi:hypothetical protein